MDESEWADDEDQDVYVDDFIDQQRGDYSDESSKETSVILGSLTDNEVRQVRKMLSRGDSLAAIARFFDVSPRTIQEFVIVRPTLTLSKK